MTASALLLAMPWHSLHYPSLALGLLKATAAKRTPDWEISTLYANLRWANFLCEHSELTPREYASISEEHFLDGVGEWVFSSSLHGVDEWQLDSYRATFSGTQEHFDIACEAHRLAPKFVDMLAEEIVRSEPDLIGLTSTFMQNVPSLALARRVKKLNPLIKIVMGGGNCDGDMGRNLHRMYEFLDFVVCGEGDEAFPCLLEALCDKRSFDTVPNLCWRNDMGAVSNAPAQLATLANMPAPCYDEYFEQLDDGATRDYVEPNLVVETSRGCWWGQKHHCTFCGLNGTGMNYRSKPAQQALEEIEFLIKRHLVLDVITSDNIVSTEYFKSFFPVLRECGWDLRVHYEAKANLRTDQIHLLREAGVHHLQPGVESLSSNVLKLMEKGISGARNLMTIRDCEEAGITCSWNYLIGFPGEDVEDYRHIIPQIPALSHLQPPSGAARIALERFSPYFDKPWLGFEQRTPAAFYSITYDKSPNEAAGIAYVFDSDPKGIDRETESELKSEIFRWRESYKQGSTLTYRDLGDSIEIQDQRPDFMRGAFVLTDEKSCALVKSMREPMRIGGLVRKLRAMGIGTGADDVSHRLRDLKSAGLIFVESGWHIALPIEDRAFRVRMME